MSEPTNVVLLCRNTIVREGLRRILHGDDFTVTQSTSDVENYTPRGAHSEDTLILLDSGSEDVDTDVLATIRKKHPASRTVVLSDRFDYQEMVTALRGGAWGYIVKEISCEPLIGTLRLVAMGEKVLPSQLADELQAHPGISAPVMSDGGQDVSNLSERELEILQWLIMGCPNKVIARHMSISEATVKVHVKAVLRKLGVKNRTQAAIWAANHGLSARSVEEDFDTFTPSYVPEMTAGLPSPEMALISN